MGRPDVSADVIVGFDHHSDEFNLNEREVNADLRSRCPVAWNEKYGGFWYVSSYDAVEQVARDGDTFAHKYEPDAADGVNYQGEMGVPRPEGQPPLGIGEVDGPYHLALRRALTPFFSSGAIEKMRPFMEQSVQWFLDQQIADGRMDLVLDYASPVPAILTMRLMGLPYDNWQLYADLFHWVMDASEADQYNKAIAEVPAMIDGLLKFAATRRADPGDDLTSFLVQFEFDGKRLDDNQLIDILWNLIGGGVDTTTSLTALSLLHLGTRPDLRQQLIDQTRAVPHRGGRVSPVLLGEQDPEPHGESRHRPWRSTASAKRPGAHQLVGGQPRRAGIRAGRRSDARPGAQSARRVRARTASLHRRPIGAGDVRGDGEGGARPNSGLRGRPRRRPSILGQSEHDRSWQASRHVHARGVAGDGTPD